jgi:hypothetical protein
MRSKNREENGNFFSNLDPAKQLKPAETAKIHLSGRSGDLEPDDSGDTIVYFAPQVTTALAAMIPE